MSTPPLSDELAQEAIDAVTKYGNVTAAAEHLKLPRDTVRRRRDVAQIRGLQPKAERVWSGKNESGQCVLVIGDQHFPFAHRDTIPFLTAAKKKFGPTRVMNLGDEADQHALSQYPPDPDGMSAGGELVATLIGIQPLYTIFPNMSVCTSNHGVRPYKRAYRAGIPSAYLKSYKEFMKAPIGWEWRDRWVIDGVVYEHGEGVSGAQGAMKKAMANMRSTVIGHIHSHAGISYFNNGEKEIWGFNAGCLIDVNTYAMAYGKHSLNKPIIGVGLVENGVPHFFPMQLTAAGAWNGRI